MREVIRRLSLTGAPTAAIPQPSNYTTTVSNVSPSPPTRQPTASEQALIDDILDLYQLRPSEKSYAHYDESATFHDPVSTAEGLDSIKTQFNGMPKLFAESVTEHYGVLESSTPQLLQLDLTQKYVKSAIPFKAHGASKTVRSKITLKLDAQGRIQEHGEEWEEHEHDGTGEDGFFGKVRAFRKKMDAKTGDQTVTSDPGKV